MSSEILYPVTDGCRGRSTDKHCAELLESRGRKRGGTVPDMMVMLGKFTETADLGSQELMEAGPTVREPEWD